PVQRPSLPIWIGSWGRPSSLRRVARLADRRLSSAGPGHPTPGQVARGVALLDTHLAEGGKDPGPLPRAASTMALYVSEDPAELAEYGGPGYVPRPAGVGVTQPETRPADDPHGHDMVGTREACIDKVRRWRAAGVGALLLVPRGPDPIVQM